MTDAGARTATVLTWNLNHWRQSPESRRAAWAHLDGTLADATGWDIALLQECVVPAERDGPVLWRELPGLGWGTAVALRTGAGTTLTELALEDDSHPGCVVAADAGLDDWTLTVASLYGRQEPRKRVGGEVQHLRYSVTAVHRMLSDVTPLVDLRDRRRSPTPIVLGGDLNVSTQVDGPDRARHAGVLQRFADLGLTDGWAVSPDAERAPDCDCPAAPGCGHVRTHTHDRSARPWQLDYLFIGRALEFTSCRTVADGGVGELSDHLPVVGVLRLR